MRRWLRDKVATPVVVHLVDDSTVSGYLSESGADGFMLSAPQLLLDDTTVPLDGQLWLPRERVHFIQTGMKAAN